MHIINIYKTKEYFHGLKFFIFEILTIILFSEFIQDKKFFYIYLILLIILFIHFLICIFLESEFDNEFLQELQLSLEDSLPFISFICLLSIAIIMVSYYMIVMSFYLYKFNCPFSMINVDYKLHIKERCELYDINKDNSILYKYQYICSFNAEEYNPSLLIKRKYADFNYIDRPRCSKVETLINNNEVINKFINEYYKEEALYYCDLISKPVIYPNINPKKCDSNIILYPEILILIHFYLTGKYFQLLIYYFKNVKANVNRNYS